MSNITFIYKQDKAVQIDRPLNIKSINTHDLDKHKNNTRQWSHKHSAAIHQIYVSKKRLVLQVSLQKDTSRLQSNMMCLEDATLR